MKNRTRTITISAVLTALTVVFLLISNFIPTNRVSLIAVSSLFSVAAVIETGIIPAIFVFAASSIIGALLLPDKSAVLIYVLFFGYYPVVKSFAERIHRRVLNWAVKLTVFNTAFSIVWFLLRHLLFDGTDLNMNIIVIYLAGNAVFILFDIGLSRLIGFYIARISKNIRKNS